MRRTEAAPLAASAVFSLMAGLSTAIARWHDRPLAAWVGLIGAVGAVAVVVWRLVAAVRRDRSAGPQAELDAVLHTLHACLRFGCSKTFETVDVRLCVFAPVLNSSETPKEVYQLTDYVGPAVRHGRGRRLSCRCGVVGQAIRTGESCFYLLPDGADLAEVLVKDFGYTPEEAATKRKDRKSYAAIPVGEPGRIIAVLYIDSDTADLFGRKNSPPRRLLDAARLGVAEFVGKGRT